MVIDSEIRRALVREAFKRLLATIRNGAVRADGTHFASYLDPVDNETVYELLELISSQSVGLHAFDRVVRELSFSLCGAESAQLDEFPPEVRSVVENARLLVKEVRLSPQALKQPRIMVAILEYGVVRVINEPHQGDYINRWPT